MPLKWLIAQLRRACIPTIKDVMHINKFIKHGELSYGKSVRILTIDVRMTTLLLQMLLENENTKLKSTGTI